MSSRPFGGDEQASTSSSTASTLLAPFSACLPTSRQSGNTNATPTAAPSFRAFFTQRQTEEESRRLLNDQDHSNSERGGRHANHDSDDTDAISLLSNIADRTGARSGASARRMARARAQRSRSRQSGWLGAGDLASSLLACGLFGRPKGAARDTERPSAGGNSLRSRNHNRSHSIGSVASSDGGQSVATTAWSDAEGGFGRLPRQGEEDAGSLGDETIAKLVHKQKTSPDHQETEARVSATSDEERMPSLPSAEAQEREEADLARQEEEAIAQARRKAERKAKKQQLAFEGSNQDPDGKHGSFRHRSLWQTEAGAEAAAGGFAFAEDGGDGEMGMFQEADLGGERAIDEDLYERDGDSQDKHFFEDTEEQQPQTIVHHHYYYDDEGQQSVDDDGETRSYTQVPALVVPAEPHRLNEQKNDDNDHDDAMENDLDEEEDADIAGLGLGRRRRGSKRSDRKRHGATEGSQGSSSRTYHSGSREATSASTDPYHSSSKQQQQQQQHPLQLEATYSTEPTTSSSLTSGGSTTNQTSSTSSAQSSSRPSYRDRPIRRGVGVGSSNAYLRSDERQDSKSTAATSVSSSASSSADAALEGSHESHRKGKGESKARRTAARKAAASASEQQQLTEEEKARRADAAAGGFD